MIKLKIEMKLKKKLKWGKYFNLVINYKNIIDYISNRLDSEMIETVNVSKGELYFLFSKAIKVEFNKCIECNYEISLKNIIFTLGCNNILLWSQGHVPQSKINEAIAYLKDEHVNPIIEEVLRKYKVTESENFLVDIFNYNHANYVDRRTRKNDNVQLFLFEKEIINADLSIYPLTKMLDSSYFISHLKNNGYNIEELFEKTYKRDKLKVSTFLNKAYKIFDISREFIERHKDEIEWNRISYWSLSDNNAAVGKRFIYKFIDLISTEELLYIYNTPASSMSLSIREFIEKELIRREVEIPDISRIKDQLAELRLKDRKRHQRKKNKRLKYGKL